MLGLGQVETRIVDVCRQRQAQGTVRTPNLMQLLMARGALEALLDFQDVDTIYGHDQRAVYSHFLKEIDVLCVHADALAASTRTALEIRELVKILGRIRQIVEFIQPGTAAKLNAKVDALIKSLSAIQIQSAEQLQDETIRARVAELEKEKAEALKKAETTGLNEVIKHGAIADPLAKG